MDQFPEPRSSMSKQLNAYLRKGTPFNDVRGSKKRENDILDVDLRYPFDICDSQGEDGPSSRGVQEVPAL